MFELSNFLLKVVLPAAIAVIVINVMVEDPRPHGPDEIIALAEETGNSHVAKAQYYSLIQSDFLNLANHRGYISNHFKIPETGVYGSRREDAPIYNEYISYSKNENPEVADIGHYGLGYCYVSQGNYAKGFYSYLKVRNDRMPFLNNSIGFLFRKQGDLDRAKQFFYKEIKSNGHMEGAYANLAEILMEQQAFDELDELIHDKSEGVYINSYYKRYSSLSNHHYVEYLELMFEYEHVTVSGLIAAILICLTWLVYLRRLDVFEPERWGALLIMLLLGVVFSVLCGPLYDIIEHYLDFRLNGDLANDLIFCIFGIGLIEETVKILPFLLFLRFSNDINESVDYPIYASVAALGFASVENLLYFNDAGLPQIAQRALSTVLLHLAWTAIAVYGIIYAKYKEKARTAPYFMATFLFAVILHGVYDFWLVGTGIPIWVAWPFYYLVLFYCVSIYANILNNALNQSEFNPLQKDIVLHLTRYLAYALSGIIIVQYILVGINKGPSFANLNFLWTVVLSYLLILIILVSLGQMKIKKSVWIPLF